MPTNIKKSTAGRKKVTDKKIRVTVFIEGSKIKARGGMEKMQQHLYNNA